MIVLVPVPVWLPGLIVQVPVAGKPLKATLPVTVRQVGWVMVPTVGVAGIAFTVIVIVFDVAGLPVAQVALDVNCTLIASPFTSVDEV